MDAEDVQSDLLISNRRNEAIYHGSIAAALMDRLPLTQEEKFYHLVVDGIVRALSKEAQNWDNKIPSEIEELIREGDQEKMRNAMDEAINGFEKARSEYEICKNSEKHKKYASSRSV